MDSMLNRLRRRIMLAIVIVSLAESLAFAGWKGAIVGRDMGGTITVDAAGTCHIVTFTAYKTLDLVYTTYNRSGVRGPLFKSNVGLTDPLAMAIATDSKNRPYVAIINENELSPQFVFDLDYLVFNGHGWDSQVIDNAAAGALHVQIIIDSNDHPHILYLKANGFLTQAYFDGSAWHFENAGVPVAPTAVKIAPDGTIHVAGVMFISGQASQVCEERGLNGSWTGECFDSEEGGAPALALAADGTPEIVYGSTENNFNYPDTVKLARFDGTNWSIDTIFEASTYRLEPFVAAYYAIDSTGLVKLLIGTYNDYLDYFFQHGDSWDLTELGSGVDFRTGPLFIPSISWALDPAGLPHFVFAPDGILTNEIIYQLYAALLSPVLTDQWQRVATKAASGKTVIDGKLLVRNIGTAPASGYTVNYYLSTDNQLDPSDTLLGRTKLALGAGQHNVVTFNFSHSGAVSGEYLIAAISPNNSPGVVNSDNSVAAALIP
jgi:hypothetical protein